MNGLDEIEQKQDAGNPVDGKPGPMNEGMTAHDRRERDLNPHGDADCFLTIGEAAERMSHRTLSARQLVAGVLSRAERVNPRINAIITFNREKAVQLSMNPLPGPLSGIPVTVKDIFETKGLRTTASHARWIEHIPETDAPVVARLRTAGAILIGKTNLPEMALDSQTDSPLFGVTNNPWNLSCTPGGSTGGGGAAIAAGLSFLETGSDLLGSIRLPAHFCGVFGFVPTDGTLSTAGSLLEKPKSFLMGRFLRTGFLARCVADLETAWRVTVGPVPEERDLVGPDTAFCPIPQPGDIRLAWSWNLDFLPLASEVRAAMQEWRDVLTAMHVSLADLTTGEVAFKDASGAFLDLFGAEMAYHMPAAVRGLMTLAGNRQLHTDLKRVWAAEQKRSDVLSQVDALLEQVDALVCPVAAVTAYPHMKPDSRMGIQPVYKKGIMVDGKPVNYATANVGYTVPFSVTGNPVLVLPVGFTPAGLPVGIQLVGRRYHDAELFALGKALERHALTPRWAMRT